MGIERVDGKIQSGVKPPQSKKPGSGISREDAETRKVWDRVPQLPMTFCGHEGVLECSGLTELWMGRERVEGENPKRCQATAVQERRIRPEFFDSNFKFQVSASPQPPSHRLPTPVSRPSSRISVILQLRDLGSFCLQEVVEGNWDSNSFGVQTAREMSAKR
jgi:hypothetical protein